MMTTWLVLPPIVLGLVDSRGYAGVSPLKDASDPPRDFRWQGMSHGALITNLCLQITYIRSSAPGLRSQRLKNHVL
jgi:hypothetical protein